MKHTLIRFAWFALASLAGSSGNLAAQDPAGEDSSSTAPAEDPPTTEEGLPIPEVVEDPAGGLDLEEDGLDEAARREKIKEYQDRYDAASPEEREKMRANRRDRWKSMSPEQKRAATHRWSDRWKDMSPKQRERFRSTAGNSRFGKKVRKESRERRRDRREERRSRGGS